MTRHNKSNLARSCEEARRYHPGDPVNKWYPMNGLHCMLSLEYLLNMIHWIVYVEGTRHRGNSEDLWVYDAFTSSPIRLNFLWIPFEFKQKFRNANSSSEKQPVRLSHLQKKNFHKSLYSNLLFKTSTELMLNQTPIPLLLAFYYFSAKLVRNFC